MKAVIISENRNWREFLSENTDFEVASVSDMGDVVHPSVSGENGIDVIFLDLDILRFQHPPQLASKTRMRFGWWPHVIAASADDVLGRDLLIDAVNSGADDFLEEPYNVDMLAAKLSAFRRRRYFEMTHFDRGIGYTVHIKDRVVLVDGEPVKLNEKEFELFSFLFGNTDSVFDRETIYRNVWGRGEANSTRTLDTHISRLRRRLHLDGSYGLRLKPVYGVGYMLARVVGPHVPQSQLNEKLLPQR